ncbi:MAG: hypothetical protein V2A79_18490, partial [Planctomycetota bacterium]
AAITCTDVMAKEHPELVITFLKGMIKVGRWTNEHKHAAAAILDKQTFYLDVEDTYEGIKHIDMVPNLSPQNLVSVEIGKDFMLSHGYIKNDFDVKKWAAPKFLEQAAKELLEDLWKKKAKEKLPEPTPWGPGSLQKAEPMACGCATGDLAKKKLSRIIHATFLPFRKVVLLCP